jgi:ABC-type glycerol-3-phosphate transport system substrate-binding protein
MKRKLKLLAIFMCVLLTLSVCISCADSDADDPELYEADFTGAFDTIHKLSVMQTVKTSLMSMHNLFMTN